MHQKDLGQKPQFLDKQGGIYNLLLSIVFDKLSAQVQQRMLIRKSIAAMGDSSGLYIYGIIYLEGHLRNAQFKVGFFIFRISDNAFLEIKFLSQDNCFVACDKSLRSVGSKNPAMHGQDEQTADHQSPGYTNFGSATRLEAAADFDSSGPAG